MGLESDSCGEASLYIYIKKTTALCSRRMAVRFNTWLYLEYHCSARPPDTREQAEPLFMATLFKEARHATVAAVGGGITQADKPIQWNRKDMMLLKTQ